MTRRTWVWAIVTVAMSVLGVRALHAQVKPEEIATREDIEVRAEPIASFLREGGTGLALSDRLVWRGGLVLTSPSKYFGGWSGLVMDADGKGFLAVSDAGSWLKGELDYEAERPVGVRAARIGPLKSKDGKPIARKRDRDAEAITLAGGTITEGRAYISFERKTRIGLFDIEDGEIAAPTGYLDPPKGTRHLGNDGIEALTVLAGGRRKGALVAFAEAPLRDDKHLTGWLWASGKPQAFAVEDIGGFAITDAASLADGSVLILERRFRWTEGLKVRLRLLPAESIAPGSTASGESLLAAEPSGAEIDNLEGLALSTGRDGETVVTIISDDNFNHLLQRTLLLQFTLKPPPAEEKRDPDKNAAATTAEDEKVAPR